MPTEPAFGEARLPCPDRRCWRAGSDGRAPDRPSPGMSGWWGRGLWARGTGVSNFAIGRSWRCGEFRLFAKSAFW